MFDGGVGNVERRKVKQAGLEMGFLYTILILDVRIQ